MAPFDISVGTVRLIGGVIVLSIVAIAALRASRLRRASQSWPTVEGTILYGHAKGVSEGSASVIWYAEMSYSFTTIQGDYYAGKFDHRTASEEQADEYARKMKDAKVSVRYKPGNPDISLATPI
jgi:hypothetical protein